MEQAWPPELGCCGRPSKPPLGNGQVKPLLEETTRGDESAPRRWQTVWRRRFGGGRIADTAPAGALKLFPGNGVAQTLNILSSTVDCMTSGPKANEQTNSSNNQQSF